MQTLENRFIYTFPSPHLSQPNMHVGAISECSTALLLCVFITPSPQPGIPFPHHLPPNYPLVLNNQPYHKLLLGATCPLLCTSQCMCLLQQLTSCTVDMKCFLDSPMKLGPLEGKTGLVYSLKPHGEYKHTGSTVMYTIFECCFCQRSYLQNGNGRSTCQDYYENFITT